VPLAAEQDAVCALAERVVDLTDADDGAVPAARACEIVVVARMQSTTMATSLGAGSRGPSATCRVMPMECSTDP